MSRVKWFEILMDITEGIRRELGVAVRLLCTLLTGKVVFFVSCRTFIMAGIPYENTVSYIIAMIANALQYLHCMGLPFHVCRVFLRALFDRACACLCACTCSSVRSNLCVYWR